MDPNLIPTPTMFPTVDAAAIGAPIFDIPPVSLWNFTDDALQAWNMIGSDNTWLQVMQGIVVLLLFIIGLWMIISFVRSLSSQDSD